MKNMERMSHENILSIRLSADGFSFAVTHPTDSKEWKYRVDPAISMTANLRQAVAVHEELGNTYRQTDVLMEGVRYTLVPLELFEDEQAEAVYAYSLGKSPMEKVEYNILTQTDAVVIFPIDKSIRAFVDEQWPGARVQAGITPLIEHWARECRQTDPADTSRRLYVCQGKRTIDVVAFDRRKLLFVNSYQVRGIEDMGYYVLNVWKHSGFNQEYDTLCLTADDRVQQQELEKLSEMLKRYIRLVSCVPFP